jgi:site-specific recombinase XerD
MSEVTPSASRPTPSRGLEPCIESFVDDLRAARYALDSISDKKRIAASFVVWLRGKGVPAHAVEESHALAFLGRRPKRSRSRHAHERAAVRGFLAHVRGSGGLGPCAAQRVLPPPTPIKQYADHLRNERGLTERSIQIYVPYVEAFLRSQAGRTGSFRARTLDARVVRDFLLERVHDRSTAYARLVAASLRSFLRFLFLRGKTPRDLSSAVPTVRRWSRVPVHAFLAPEAIDRVLAIPDRATPSGRRDYAILLLLARLGLRAGEVVSLELGDIRWRAGEIVVRGKGRSVDRLPLLSDVGEALSDHLQASRILANSRRVFLRKIAPRVGLTGPSAIGCVVRNALARAGVPRPYRYAAHIFRHSLATRMIRHGASIPEISEVLRHRCPATTEIYAKVDFETLRGVCRAWPVADVGSDR